MSMVRISRAPTFRSNTMIRTYQTVTFQHVKHSLQDPIQILKKETDADNSPSKVDIGVGVYRNEQGQSHEFDTVREAKKRLDALQLGHEYNPTTGIRSFNDRAARLLFGENFPAYKEGRIASVQTVGGTGANRVGAAFLRRNLYSPSDDPIAFLGEPAWGNYRPLFENAGFRVESYEYCKRGATEPNHNAILSTIEAAPSGSVFILQASCHNPTGLEYTRDQWQAISQAMSLKNHFAFFDAAYLGFGSGKTTAADEDSWALRHFVEQGVDVLVCQSFSKTFGLYSERVGALHVVCHSPEIMANVFDQLRAQIRWEVSSCPAYGARLVDMILEDKKLTADWEKELNEAAARIERNRHNLYNFITGKFKTPGSWEHIISERGLFSYLQLSKAQIDQLKTEHHVYFPPNGRINVAGLSRDNTEQVAQAIDTVVRGQAQTSEKLQARI